jgi:5-methylcytosine-specific restriction endonuclease McrA
MTLKRDSFTCRYCGRSPIDNTEVKLHIDHLIPSAEGGEDSLANYVTACAECNSGKKDTLLEEFERDRIRNRPQLNRDYSDVEKQWLDKVGNSKSPVS